jgi:trigger factor
MPQIMKEEYTNEITYVLDYLVEEETYQAWKKRITNQALKNVDVQGFRKGKVPMDIALKNINQNALNEMVVRETLEKFGVEAVSKLSEKLREDKRVILNVEVASDPKFTGEIDKSFQLRLIASLLPVVDLSNIEKLEISKDYSLSDRPSKEQFITLEKSRFLRTYNKYSDKDGVASTGDLVVAKLIGKINGTEEKKLSTERVEIVLGSNEFLPEFEQSLPGIKKGEKRTINVIFPNTYFEASVAGREAVFEVECLELKSAYYQDLEELFEKEDSIKDQFENIQEFYTFLDKFYDDETEKLSDEMKQKAVINAAVTQIKDFALPEDKVESEVSRIFEALSLESQSKSITIAQAFLDSGIPNTGLSKSADEIEIKQKLQEYVKNEFKLSYILHSIYEELVTTKITPKELTQAVKQIKENPQQFRINQNSTDSQIQDFALDRLKRQAGAKYLFGLYS